MEKFQEWIKQKKPAYLVYEENGERLLSFNFNREPGFCSDGWYIGDDPITKTIFADDDDFSDEAQEFLESIPEFNTMEAGSCTYFIDGDSEEKICNYLNEQGFIKEEPKW